MFVLTIIFIENEVTWCVHQERIRKLLDELVGSGSTDHKIVLGRINKRISF